MERVYGDIEGLKKSIRQKYERRINQIKKETDARIEKIEKEQEKAEKTESSALKESAISEARKVYLKNLGEEETNAKRMYEERREDLINSAFKHAEKKALDIAHSKEYLSYVKKNLPKEEYEAYGDSSYYKKILPKLKTEKDMIGVKLKAGNVTYDFTLDGAMISRKELLRNEVNRTLFGG